LSESAKLSGIPDTADHEANRGIETPRDEERVEVVVHMRGMETDEVANDEDEDYCPKSRQRNTNMEPQPIRPTERRNAIPGGRRYHETNDDVVHAGRAVIDSRFSRNAR